MGLSGLSGVGWVGANIRIREDVDALNRVRSGHIVLNIFNLFKGRACP